MDMVDREAGKESKATPGQGAYYECGTANAVVEAIEELKHRDRQHGDLLIYAADTIGKLRFAARSHAALKARVETLERALRLFHEWFKDGRSPIYPDSMLTNKENAFQIAARAALGGGE